MFFMVAWFAMYFFGLAGFITLACFMGGGG
jgi:hypothetical protein